MRPVRISKNDTAWKRVLVKQAFSDKTREHIWARARHTCELEASGCIKRNFLAPHHIIANTTTNRRVHGNDVIQSARNGVLLCASCHEKHYYRYTGLRDD